jgi:hypothetical protein
VKCPAHLERKHAFGPSGLAAFSCLLHGGRIAGNDRLIRRVQVRRHRDRVPARSLATGGVNIARGQTDHGAHRPGTLGSGLVHQLTPATDQPRPIFRAQRPGRHVGAVFTQAVACGGFQGRRESFPDDGPDRRRVSEYRGLSVVGQGELFLRTLPHDAGKRSTQRPSIRWKTSRAAGKRSARSLPIPTFCAPCPGQSRTLTTG